MWKSPIYNFQVEKEDKKGRISREDKTIDVTKSAPPMEDPGKQLSAVFEKITQGLEPSTSSILDLGAARLRNTLYLLEKGFNVYCAEFKELFDKGKKAKENLEIAQSYPNFRQLIFPNEFYEFIEKFDIILLINVPPIMPIPIERFALLSICREKLKNNGKLLWYSDPLIRNKKKERVRKYLDGYLSGQKTYSFYVELLENEIETMLNLSGFEIDKIATDELKKFAFRNIVYLANPKRENLLSNAVDIPKLIETGTYDEEGGIYLTTNLPSILTLISRELKSTPPGLKDAYKYHHLIANALKNIFDVQLGDMEVEAELYEGDARIDIIFRRLETPGFFREIKQDFNIFSPYIKIECKNSLEDPGNPQFDQLNDRLNERTGLFGILCTRKIQDKQKCLRHRHKRLVDHKHHIIVLEDDNIFSIINSPQVNKTANELLRKKLKELLFFSLTSN